MSNRAIWGNTFVVSCVCVCVCVCVCGCANTDYTRVSLPLICLAAVGPRESTEQTLHQAPAAYRPQSRVGHRIRLLKGRPQRMSLAALKESSNLFFLKFY
jgi:hypothetical protein